MAEIRMTAGDVRKAELESAEYREKVRASAAFQLAEKAPVHDYDRGRQVTTYTEAQLQAMRVEADPNVAALNAAAASVMTDWSEVNRANQVAANRRARSGYSSTSSYSTYDSSGSDMLGGLAMGIAIGGIF